MSSEAASSSLPLCVLVESGSPATVSTVRAWLADETLIVIERCDARGRSFVDASPDLIVVDCASSDDDGAMLVVRCRRRWPSAAIVCLSARHEGEAVALMIAGADGVSHAGESLPLQRELVRAAARRMRIANAQIRVAFGDLVYDREACRLWCAGREVALTKRERQVFDCLFLHAETPVSVNALQDYVWREEPSARSNPVAVYVRSLRQKLIGSRAAFVSTLRGHGYQLTRRGEGV